MHAMQALSQLSYSPVSGNLDGYCWILPAAAACAAFAAKTGLYSNFRNECNIFYCIYRDSQHNPSPKEKPAWC
ncbi:hypothetical protein CT19425_U20001 [Cupriavidus taiwanensis]|uniref:Uncharacterized protein n=1 Tax=Cupriavidus taiwanensis TaxID=164546 RepID=A0A375I9A8_9BURK|nr:hypothetical protein CT19425_U20001 [Cupriavidus taiwanensis]